MLGQRCYGGVRALLDHPCPRNVQRLDHGALPMILEFHRNGILIDPGHFKSLGAKLDAELERTRKAIWDAVGVDVNPNSDIQVAQLLFEDLKLRPPTGLVKTKGGAWSTEAEVLKSMLALHPVVLPILDGRGATKLKGTYVDKLPGMVGPDGRLRTTYKYTRTNTGRLSSEDPNLQNIPTRSELGNDIRNGFVAAPGKVLVSADLSQIEMVVAGDRAQDKVMLDAFRQGADIHTLTAVKAFKYDEARARYMVGLSLKAKHEEEGKAVEWGEQEKKDWKFFKRTHRLPAKTVGFGILYGQTATGARANIIAQGGPLFSEEECEEIIQGWFALYSGIRDWMQLQYSRARRFGMVWDMFGRFRLTPAAMSTVARLQRAALREAGNMPIQSGAGGILKLAMAEIMPVVMYYRERGCTCLPLLQVHDELIFEVDREIAEEFAEWVRFIMMGAVRLSVPYNASAGIAERWGDLK